MKKYNKPELNMANITANQTIATTLQGWLESAGSAQGYSEEVIVSYVIASE